MQKEVRYCVISFTGYTEPISVYLNAEVFRVTFYFIFFNSVIRGMGVGSMLLIIAK